MTITPEAIQTMARQELDEVRHIRRYLHAHPELSFREENTAKYISQKLTAWGIAHTTGVAGYGITGVIQGNGRGSKVIALRADMDALPIDEQNRVPYKSLNSGVMHACGHDVHMSCLLGALKILKDTATAWKGSVKFIFQPAEEKLPGGAKAMIEEGVLEHPAPDVVVAQHVLPELEAGKVGFKPGKYMAASDEVNLYVKGRGGHAAIAAQFDNTVLALAQIIVAIENRINSHATDKSPTILSFGKIVADGAHNVIPGSVSAHGTFRSFDESWRNEAHGIIKEETSKIASKHGCVGEVVIDKGYPFVMNNERVTRKLIKAAQQFLGKEQVTMLDIRMTVDDFGYFSQVMPACYYRLGVAEKNSEGLHRLHTPSFDVDEQSLVTGTGLLVWNALTLLEQV